MQWLVSEYSHIFKQNTIVSKHTAQLGKHYCPHILLIDKNISLGCDLESNSKSGSFHLSASQSYWGCLRVQGALLTSQIDLGAQNHQRTAACVGWGLRHSGRVKRHIQRIIQGRLTNFLEKALVWMDTDHLKEGRKLHCAFPSSSAHNASTCVATIQIIFLDPKVFIDVLWVCIFTLHIWFVQKTAGVQLKQH